jgi:ABC-type nitrate/sulfonate/bicarbonate transport system permease component
MVTVAPVATTRSSDSVRVLAIAHLVGRRIAGPLIVLVLWQLASTLQWVDPRFVPSPVTVASSLEEWMFGPVGATPYSGTWFMHAANSSYRVLVGFLLAAASGVLIGCLIGWFRLQ